MFLMLVLLVAVGQVHRAGPRVDAEVRDVIHPVRKSINNNNYMKHQIKEDIKKKLTRKFNYSFCPT